MIPDSFKLQSTSTANNRTEQIYKGPRGEARAVLLDLADGQVFDEGYLSKNLSYATSTNNEFDMLTLVMLKYPEQDPTATVIRKDYDTEYELRVNYIEEPLEAHINYRAIWNNDLYVAVEASNNTKRTGESTVDDMMNMMSPTALHLTYTFPYVFATDNPGAFLYRNTEGIEVEHLWELEKSRIKPGQEYFLIPQPVVYERIYFKRKKKAEQNLTTAAKIKKPKETFSYSGEWLCQPDGVSNDGDYYVTNNTYLYAISWDKDMYEIAN